MGIYNIWAPTKKEHSPINPLRLRLTCQGWILGGGTKYVKVKELKDA